MDKLQATRGIAFDLDGTLVDSAPGLTSAVDQALYALELPVAGEERVCVYEQLDGGGVTGTVAYIEPE